MDFSVLDNENVQNHMRRLEQAYASGASAGAIGHIENQLNQAMRDAQASTPSPAPSSNQDFSPAPSGGGTSSAPPPPPPPPAPILPSFRPMTITNKNFKVAPTDIIQFDDEAVEIALIQDLLFEDIGATELANISRSDLIDGQTTIYSPIKNLSVVRREFNPNNVIITSFDSDYFSRFGINIDVRGIYNPYVDQNGNIIIEIDTVEDDEEIQVEIVSNGTIDMIEEI